MAAQGYSGPPIVVRESGGGVAGLVVGALMALVALQLLGVINVWDLAGKPKTTVETRPTVIVQPTQRPVAPPVQPAPIQPAPPVVAPPAEPPVVPQEMPPTAIPPEQAAQYAKIYELLVTPPTVGVYGTNPECNSANATYRTDPVQVEVDGVPIGVVHAWSCESEAAAVAEHQRLVAEMVDKYRATHP